MTPQLRKGALLSFLLAAFGVQVPQARAELRREAIDLDRPTPGESRDLQAPAPERESEPERRVGPYRLIRELGAGGMGVVHLAESTGAVRRRVALKQVRDGIFSPAVTSRFAVERQALAAIEHEHVVRLYDWGESDEGRPWLAMELFDGESITEYCDRRRLGLDERLALFADVARAVAHLHERGVLHGDLKPDNILVRERDGRPTPKLIDLGLARIDGEASSSDTVVMGTPAYMAPEMFEFDATSSSTRSDVYALGVVLRELLIGRDPRAASNRSAPAMWLKSRSAARKPSDELLARTEGVEELAHRRGLDGRALTRRLRRGLDSIVARATSPKLTKRTRGAAELAEQLDAELAREDARQSRLRRWSAVAAAALAGAAAGWFAAV